MLRNTKDLAGARLGAQDGEIGHLKDLYFDDQTWAVRYLVADTGTWLPGKKVLLAPSVIKCIHFAAHRVIEVNLTKSQIEGSPPMDVHQPVSQKLELEYRRYGGWPDYWVGPLSWGPVVLPGTEAHVLPQGTPRMPPGKSRLDPERESRKRANLGPRGGTGATPGGNFHGFGRDPTRG